MKYDLYAGLGGRFGGANLIFKGVEYDNKEEATKAAYEYAVEEYQFYEGCYGLSSYGDIEANPEEYGLDENPKAEDVDEVYIEEMEDWIEYYAIPTAKEINNITELLNKHEKGEI